MHRRNAKYSLEAFVNRRAPVRSSHYWSERCGYGGRARDLLFDLFRRRNDLHGAPVGEDRQVAQDHLFRAFDRCPRIRAVGRRWELVIGDLDPLAVADARLDLGPHRLAVLVLPAVTSSRRYG